MTANPTFLVFGIRENRRLKSIDPAAVLKQFEISENEKKKKLLALARGVLHLFCGNAAITFSNTTPKLSIIWLVAAVIVRMGMTK